MSLQYVIDGYNIINHPAFIRSSALKKSGDNRLALIRFIIANKTFKNPHNSVTVVFDGFCAESRQYNDCGVKVIFSGEISADEAIKKILESSPKRGNIIVVSDDRQIQLFTRLQRAKAMSVEEFIPQPKPSAAHQESVKLELNYTQIEKINKELRKLWLG